MILARRCVGWAAVLLLAAVPAIGRANTPTLSPEECSEVKLLIEQLGDRSYKVREEASHKIVRYGRAVEPILRERFNDPDPEVRSRCRQLLPVAIHHDLEKYIAAFLADKEDKEHTPLAGWKRFKELAGHDDTAKNLFADMHRFDTDFLEMIQQAPDEVNERVEARCLEFLTQCNQIRTPSGSIQMSAPQLALLLFAVQDSNLELKPKALQFFSSALHSLSYQPAGKSLMRDNLALRKLLVQYFMHNNVMVYNNFYALANLELPEGVDIAKKFILSPDTDSYKRALAVQLLARVGTKDNIADILPFLEKTDTVGTMNINNVNIQTQMRDVALFSLVNLSGQKIGDYEFAYLKMFGGNGANVNFMMSPAVLGFSDDMTRTNSIKKWKDWYEKSKK